MVANKVPRKWLCKTLVHANANLEKVRMLQETFSQEDETLAYLICLKIPKRELDYWG